MSPLDAVVCAGLGAFAYHVYAKVRNIESAMGGTQVISIGAVLDKADDTGDTDGRFKFGFHSNRRQHGFLG